MPLLSREAILAAPVPSTEVEVPEWGGTVRVQALTVRLRVLLIDAVVANEAAHRAWKADEAKPEAERTGVERVDLYDQTILSVLHAIVDEEGERMFDLTDYDAFTGLGYQSILDLWRAMSDLNTADIETEKKSYAKTPKSSSSTGSRSRSAKP